MSQNQQKNLQDAFLNYVRKNRMSVTVFLVNGVKLQGVISWYDNFSMLLNRDGYTQMVYKHAISTVMPLDELSMSDISGDETYGNQ